MMGYADEQDQKRIAERLLLLSRMCSSWDWRVEQPYSQFVGRLGRFRLCVREELGRSYVDWRADLGFCAETHDGVLITLADVTVPRLEEALKEVFSCAKDFLKAKKLDLATLNDCLKVGERLQFAFVVDLPE